MSKCGLIINIIRNNNHLKMETLICENIDDAKNKFIEYIANILYKNHYNHVEEEEVNVNLESYFPLNLEDFGQQHWFESFYQPSFMCNKKFYKYKLFINNEWINPWAEQDIYLLARDKVISQAQTYYDNYYITNPTPIYM